MSEQFTTNFAARLSAAIGATDTVFVLTSVPSGLLAGTYRFRLGTNQRTSEWIAADYPGAGTTFVNAQRGNEGGNPALAWAIGTPVAQTLTGKSFSALRGDVTAQLATQPDPRMYARSVAARLYLANTFS